MDVPGGPAVRAVLTLLVLALVPGMAPAQTGPAPCAAEQSVELAPTDPALCARLAPVIRDPSALPLDRYQTELGDFLRAFCHRDAASGWRRDKSVRDVGPYIATLAGGSWTGRPYGTHEPVVIWYSPEMIDWMRDNRPADEHAAPANQPPVPDGAVMVKEMFPPPAAACAAVDPMRLLPTSGAAVMVRDRDAAFDGWFWGWFGWSGWDPDWPAGPTNRYPYMGFGQYCVNCHASADGDLTFASLRNVEGEAGRPLVFLSQSSFFDTPGEDGHHRLVSLPSDDAPRLGEPRYAYDPLFLEAFPPRAERPSWETVPKMPSETYDNVWVRAGGPTAADAFVTSDQCIGCHDAGGTGLQFDMTVPNPHGDDLLNLSPYATWRTSPMGLGGRDPIFFAQLASEVQTFHPRVSPLVQDTCLGCHGILGQRQLAIDGAGSDTVPCDARSTRAERHRCFLRAYADAAPWPSDAPQAELARYGALARDGISCTACHHMLVGKGPEDPAIDAPENRGVRDRQRFLNPQNTGFAATFTGSFLVGPPAELYGPFDDPKPKPMEHALGIAPVHDPRVRSSELCGSCHTVHLPVMHRGEVIDFTYEQTTYAEWAFSAYRTGTMPDGRALPEGAGDRAESCQQCHMPSRHDDGTPFRSKIAGIQEHSSFPQAEYNLGPEDIDLAVREGFARHTLVGLNVFLIKMAQQFPDVLGIRTQDPMLVARGLDPLLLTEQAMLDQASDATAMVAVEPTITDGSLETTVRIDSLVGHKFPSGVGFRRAFLTFEVLDALGGVLWASGRTDGLGRLVGRGGRPIAGERWWSEGCAWRLGPGELPHQPHYQVIDREDQAQIYQELVTAPPPDEADPTCGHHAPTAGALTTSFLSICGHVKDNRILPHGFLDLAARTAIAERLGAGADLAEDAGATAVGDDPDYVRGGGDSLIYRVPLDRLGGRATSVRATLFYQAIPPYYLEDRFCTAQGADTDRLYFLAGHLNLEGTEAAGWKLEVTGSGTVALPPAEGP